MKDDTDYVQRNIQIINDFYDSDYYSSLEAAGEKNLIRAIIDTIYIDPDIYDIHVYENLSQKLNLAYNCNRGKYELDKDREIKLSADAVCGWKQLYDQWNGNKNWLDNYEKIRTCTAAYLVWPKHNLPTINTCRYKVFKDRVDYTLFDIRQFFDYKKKFDENKNEKQFETNVMTCKLHKAYLNPKGNTRAWLMTFDGFEDFIDKMCLTRFVNSEYKVINLEDNSVITKYSSSYSFTETYLENLKNIIKN